MFGYDPMSIAVGVGIGIVGGKAAKEIIVKIFPVTAPFFAKLDLAQRQLTRLIGEAEHVDEKKLIEHAENGSKAKAASKLLQNLLKKKNA